MSDTALLGYATVAKQTGKGAAPLPADLAANGLVLTGFDLNPQTDVVDSDPEIDGTRDPRIGSSRFGGARVGGGIEGNLRYALLPLFLQSLGFTFAAPVEVGAGSGAYRHTGTLSQGAPTWLAFETSWGLQRAVRRFTDCLLDELVLSVEADGDATFTASVVGIGEAWQGSPTVVTVPAADARGNYIGSAVTLDGLGTYRWASVEAAIRSGLSTDEFVVGSRLLDDVTPGQREIVLSGSVRLGNNTPSLTDLYRAAVYGSKSATSTASTLEPYSTSAAVTFGSNRFIGTSNAERYRAVLTMPSAVLRGFPLDADGDDPLEVDLELRAMGTGVTVDVYNARSTAY